MKPLEVGTGEKIIPRVCSPSLKPFIVVYPRSSTGQGDAGMEEDERRDGIGLYVRGRVADGLRDWSMLRGERVNSWCT